MNSKKNSKKIPIDPNRFYKDFNKFSKIPKDFKNILIDFQKTLEFPKDFPILFCSKQYNIVDLH